MSLTGCTQEEAEKALHECGGNTVDAVDKILNIPPSKFVPKKKELDENQKKFAEMRANMESMDRLNDTKLMKKDQPDCSSSPKLKRTLSLHPEELLLDSTHTQQSQIVIPELEEQKPETACPSQSE